MTTKLDQQTDFETLRARLVQAQRAEEAAISALNDFTTKATRDKAKFQQLLDAAHAARDQAMNAYQEWSRAVQAAQEQP